MISVLRSIEPAFKPRHILFYWNSRPYISLLSCPQMSVASKCLHHVSNRRILRNIPLDQTKGRELDAFLAGLVALLQTLYEGHAGQQSFIGLTCFSLKPYRKENILFALVLCRVIVQEAALWSRPSQWLICLRTQFSSRFRNSFAATYPASWHRLVRDIGKPWMPWSMEGDVLWKLFSVLSSYFVHFLWNGNRRIYLVHDRSLDHT